ncbi:hypothetical protein Tco_0381995, partial [Tanacetum coccineum]
MHQPWRTLAAIINRCLFGKTASNDKLYLAYQVDHRKEKRSRHENMPFPQFTKMFIKYSAGQIFPKKSRGKGSQRKKTADESQETVDVSEESEPEPKSTRAKQVYATHARIVTEFVPEYAKKKTSRSSKSKLKGVPSLTPEEQEVADIVQALKESKKTSKRQLGIRGSNEGTGTKLGVPNESIVVSAISSEGTSTKLGVHDKEKDITEENVILEWGSKEESKHFEEDKLDDNEKDEKEGDANDEDDETEFESDDIYKYKIRVRKDKDDEMINAEVDDFDEGDEEVTDAEKANTHFRISTVKDTADADVSSLMDIPIQQETPQI